jgi:hypothetical protein
MIERTGGTMITMVRTIPALPVKRIATAVEFYHERMGFAAGYTDESFGIVTRDGVEIHLWAAADDTWSQRPEAMSSRPVVSGAESFLAGTVSCRIEVGGIDELYAEFKRSDVLYGSDTVVEGTAWGTREFPALDLERNLLTFFERVAG